MKCDGLRSSRARLPRHSETRDASSCAGAARSQSSASCSRGMAKTAFANGPKTSQTRRDKTCQVDLVGRAQEYRCFRWPATFRSVAIKAAIPVDNIGHARTLAAYLTEGGCNVLILELRRSATGCCDRSGVRPVSHVERIFRV